LAEDNSVNQKLAVCLLQKHGHTVVVAENGQRALDALKGEAFDALLMDVQMPVMGGFEATAAIRAAERGAGRHLPIIATTAHAMKGDRERCLEAGMDAYLVKPLRVQDLLRTLADVADTKAAPVQASKPARLVNEDELLELAGGDAELRNQLVELFLREAPRLLAQVRTAIDAHDSSRLERSAHAIKGSMLTFVRTANQGPAMQLEEFGHRKEWTGVEEAYAALQRDLGRLESALTPLLSATAT
jgi:CheY-like chemotaxis protein/HPt (histidine-containing phosphotransfer) domain-containing protein